MRKRLNSVARFFEFWLYNSVYFDFLSSAKSRARRLDDQGDGIGQESIRSLPLSICLAIGPSAPGSSGRQVMIAEMSGCFSRPIRKPVKDPDRRPPICFCSSRSRIGVPMDGLREDLSPTNVTFDLMYQGSATPTFAFLSNAYPRTNWIGRQSNVTLRDGAWNSLREDLSRTNVSLRANV
jgi:hypothetical protein